MKVNYDEIYKNIIKNLDYKPKILLHSCCGPCSTKVIEDLINYFDITVLYYNPNIEPEEEYNLRKSEQIKFIQEIGNVKFMDILYSHEDYVNVVEGLENEPEGGKRCTKCISLRLNKTAKLALENNFDYFGTTLSVSPHKNSQLINEIGKSLEEEYCVNYLYSDFKKNNGYLRSIELAKKYNLYRQNYCGCLFAKNKM